MHGEKMKKSVLISLVTLFATVTANAEDDLTGVGINIGANTALGIQAEFDVSARFNNDPVRAQAFLKNFTQSTSYGNSVTWDTTAIGVAAIYDFNAKYQLDSTVHPYAGAGLMYIHKRWTGTWYIPEPSYNGVKSGLYVTAGLTYTLTPRISTDINYNNFGTFTGGMNVKY